MRIKDLILLVVCFIVAGSLLFLAEQRLDSINNARSEMHLITNPPLENAPPSLAFATVAMGAFRGLIVDILWMRADKLKEDGQFFDAKQLAEWITIMQPRFATVWDFQAWNMAYNISVAMPASQPQERWRWVRNGYELLRDKGIPQNPNNIELYRSLGWIFQHKIGGVTDDVHKYYKLQLYNEMTPLIYPGTEEVYKLLAQAPKTFDDLLLDANMVDFLNALAESDEVFADKKKAVQAFMVLKNNPDRFSQETNDVIQKYIGKPVLRKFDIFTRAYYMRNTLKLDLDLVDQLNQQYGPVDYNDPNKVIPLNWAHPDAHAIYWAVKGLTLGGKAGLASNELNTDRMVFHSLQNLYLRGKMIVYNSRVQMENDPCQIGIQQSVFLFPDLRMFDRYSQAIDSVLKKYGDAANSRVTSIHNGRRNLFQRAVLLFYQAGNIEKATEIYNTLRKDYPERENLHVSLGDYVRDRFTEQLRDIGIHDAREMIITMLMEGYQRYALMDDDEAYGREKMAREIYDYYGKEFNDEEVDRVKLPEFSILRYIGLTGFLNNDRYPQALRNNLLGRIKMERPDLFEQLQEQEKVLMEEMEKYKEQQQPGAK